jgi:hypothetical protein
VRAKLLSLVAVGGLLVAAAWSVKSNDDVQAESVPEEYRETVQKGLEFLGRRQFEDGHWEETGGAHPVEMTGLVGLAFLMENAFGPRDELEHAGDPRAIRGTRVRKAADWLIAKSQAYRDGLIFSEHASETACYMNGHGFATLFLAGLLESDRNDELRKKVEPVVARAVKYIVNSQSSQGGWYDTSKLEGHDFSTIQATVIQIQALQAAENAGVPVPSTALRDAEEYLRTALIQQEAQDRREPDEMPAALAGYRPRRDHVKRAQAQKWFEHCRSNVPIGRDLQFGRDERLHYYFAQTACGAGNWKEYRAPMFEYLKRSQNKDGSWPVGEEARIDRVHAAAVWCTILQLDNGHPSSRLNEIVK